MKKAWNDVKSFMTIVLTIAFVIFTFMKLITGEQFYNIFLTVAAFYFGTQYQKNVASQNAENTEKTGNDSILPPQ